MAKNLPLPQTEPLTVKTPSTTKRLTNTLKSRLHTPEPSGFGHLVVGAVAIATALLTTSQSNLAQLLERQVQTLFFELRGPVSPPQEVVILAIDEDSLSQGTKVYPLDPQKYAFLEPLQTWPWSRVAYAHAIDRLMTAGARSVAVDLIFDSPSSYAEGDRAFQQVLQRYAGRITLAAKYEDTTTPQGILTQLVGPHDLFQTKPMSVGLINYPVEPNSRIHALGSRFARQVEQTNVSKPPPEWLIGSQTVMPSFAEATMRTSQRMYPAPRGENLFFYGPAGTFKQIPFWQVLDPASWERLVKSGEFKDKIVLIGPTFGLSQDFHAAPFSESPLYPQSMSGVELNANAIATLLEDKAIADGIPSAPLQGAFVFVVVVVAGYLQSRAKRSLRRFALAMGIVLLWGILTYLVFTQKRLILPAAVPMAAIALSGTGYLFIGIASEKFKLRRTIKSYAGSPLIQEIISKSEQDDLKDLLPAYREQEMFGKTLAGRYTIKKVLGSGGFGETYVAEDTQRPGNPVCVVKQLRPNSNNPKLFHLARRLFQQEAEALEKLGKHDQIPQLLAYFEEDQEFYLAQEFIAGQPLSSELSLGKQEPEFRVVAILQELLTILEFVHRHNVIHRDIKPNNIIRRRSDGKLVLIDFGAVKEISQITEDDRRTGFTVGIGTQGYMSNEQCAGNPRLNSDIYAVGMIGIQALTGLSPSQLIQDKNTGEISWKHRAQVSYALAEVLSNMVRYDFRHRYQSATEALQALQALGNGVGPSTLAEAIVLPPQLDTDVIPLHASTQPWPNTFGESNDYLPLTEAAPDRDTKYDS
ncbi:MAG: CHASE2 domain-containing protein [Lyngbya sp. HA4199-MV5]|jgi:CHASE2 domain-containing sensor protein/predicted Ser/Thr protein kinase|nr:CHASE2 domain-containing protein [Lyngbya sp. HA4199-MV5]